MNDLLDKLDSDLHRLLKKKKRVEWTAPMLATLSREVFSDPDWLFERKLDGERCLAIGGGRPRLWSRNRQRLNDTYPELVDALAGQECSDFIVDGEVVAFSGAVTSFSRLQQRLQIKDAEEARSSGVAVYYYLFDLLYLDGHDLASLPLTARKSLLNRAFSFEDPLRYTPHRNGRGEQYFEEACAKGWEGIVAKKSSSAYRHERSRDWLKFKCGHRQEFVIGGYTDPRGSRTGFGALLIGYYDHGELRYGGKVGTGYDEATLRRLHEKLSSLERRTSPFADLEHPEKDMHWVTPKLVAQVGFTEWTGRGRLRHPRFLGLRRDKDPEQVVREEPR